MMKINFLNVEKLVFLDSKLRNLLTPNYKTIFSSWSISQQSPKFRPLGQKMLIDFINSVDELGVKIISEYFNEEVKVERIDPNVVTTWEISIYEAEDLLNSKSFLSEALTVYREDDKLYISTWR